MGLTLSQIQNISSPNGNSLAVFIDGLTGVLLLKDVNGHTEPLSNYVCGGGGGENSPFAFNSNGKGIQPIKGNNVSCGNYATIGGGFNNNALGYNDTIGGGVNNSTNSLYGDNTIAGGQNIFISGGYNSFIGGGAYNVSSSSENAIGGGALNTASGFRATIGGGYRNISSSGGSVVVGGQNNTASNCCSSVVGGCGNTASGLQSFVGSGRYNTASGYLSFIGGGNHNCALGRGSFIGGGYYNKINERNAYSVIVGGYSNSINNLGYESSGYYNSIISGCGNSIFSYCITGNQYDTEKTYGNLIVGGQDVSARNYGRAEYPVDT